MRQYAILLLTVLGLSFWLFSKPATTSKNPHLATASQFGESDDDTDQEYDIHESVGVKKNIDSEQNSKAKLKNLKQQEQKNPIQNPPNKTQNLLEHSGYSKLDIDRLIKLCQYGDSRACHLGGVKLFNTDANSAQAAKLLARGCSLKNYEDCQKVGDILKNTQGKNKALPYYQAACEQAGLANSCFETASIMVQKSQSSPSELERIKGYFNIACLEGNAQGCLSLANYYVSNWSQHQYYMTEACKLDATLDTRQCQQLIN